MKKLIILFIVTICSNLSAQNLTRKVLFLGNSYTEVNNLPQIVANVAASAGDVLLFDSNTPGGYRLLQHTTNTVTQNKIMANDWDYVVLQGQSQEPIINEDNFHYGARDLKNMIKQNNPCSTPILYMTWGRKNGDPINCPNFPVMCTYEGMDTALKNAYLEVAEHLRTEVSPVSVVWKYLRQNYPNIELYQADESHPSAAGSYAAACCFYATIFKKDPTLITFNYNLNPDDAAIIRNAAKLNVYDNLSTWDYKQMPIADFTYTIGNGTNEVIFNNTMQNVDTYLWDFGDGTTSSTSLNPFIVIPITEHILLHSLQQTVTYKECINRFIQLLLVFAHIHLPYLLKYLRFALTVLIQSQLNQQTPTSGMITGFLYLVLPIKA